MRRVGGVGASVRAVKRDREPEELIASWTLVGDDWRLVEDIKADELPIRSRTHVTDARGGTHPFRDEFS
jgi:hypothetical protein